MTVAEANGRSSLFVGAVSSGLIALAFVGQLSHLGPTFYVFSLVVIPTLLFMGLITFERVLQSGSADFMYAIGINRIRLAFVGSYQCGSRHLLCVCCSPSALSVGAMDAGETPLSKPTRIAGEVICNQRNDLTTREHFLFFNTLENKE
jgi:hypothetical protein